MGNGYFRRVQDQTPTMFWVNNPTREEAEMALAAGAVGCTCNPSYCQKMLDHPKEGAYALSLLDQVLEETNDDSQAESLFQCRLALPILEKFRPLYEKTPRRDGFVSLQGDPIREEEAKVILSEGRANRALAPNVVCRACSTAWG